jgi:hypothetical protein
MNLRQPSSNQNRPWCRCIDDRTSLVLNAFNATLAALLLLLLPPVLLLLLLHPHSKSNHCSHVPISAAMYYAVATAAHEAAAAAKSLQLREMHMV